MNKPDIKRNTLFIDKKFQTRSIVVVISIIALSGFLSGLILYFMLSSELSTDLQVAHSQIKNTWESLGPAIIFGNVFTVIVAAVVAAIAVLYQSHKVAGPMYRLKSICDEVSQGNFNPVTSLRKADQLIALANSFETMVNSLNTAKQQREEAINDIAVQMDQLIKETQADAEVKVLTELRDKLSNIK